MSFDQFHSNTPIHSIPWYLCYYYFSKEDTIFGFGICKGIGYGVWLENIVYLQQQTNLTHALGNDPITHTQPLLNLLCKS